jgi:hypothetical protein
MTDNWTACEAYVTSFFELGTQTDHVRNFYFCDQPYVSNNVKNLIEYIKESSKEE